jgi:hypothetical protein
MGTVLVTGCKTEHRRRIFAPTKERDGTRRIKTNDELDET